MNLSTSSIPSAQSLIVPGYVLKDQFCSLALQNTDDFLTVISQPGEARDPPPELKRIAEFDSFFDVLEEVYRAAELGRTPEVDVVYDNVNIFGRIPLSVIRHTNPEGFRTRGSNRSWRYIQDLHPVQQIALFRLLPWYKRCSAAVRHRVRSMISNGKLLQLKEVLNSVDGIMSSLYLAFGKDLADLSSRRDNPYWFTDRIMVSILSNILFNNTFLPRWKKFKKQYRKAVLSESSLPDIPQDMSWLRKLAPLHARTKLGATRLMNFAQTRNTGLGINESGEQASINKFVETVTDTSKTYTDLPYDYLISAFSHVDKRTMARAIHAPRESISTTAKFESGRHTNGAAKLAVDLIELETIRRIRQRKSAEEFATYILIAICVLMPIALPLLLVYKDIAELFYTKGTTFIDLETGEDTGVEIPLDQAGELIFHSSLWKHKRKYPFMQHTNISCIREPGPKWRTVTASSFYHAECLQPWSHLTLEILKSFPETASGISKSRHGWEFAKSLSPEDPNLHWLWDNLGDIYGLSTDLETATDYGHHEVARSVIDAFQHAFGIPKWYSEVVKQLLTLPHIVFYKGSELCRTRRSWLMGDPGTKTILTAVGLAVVTKVRQNYNQHLFARVIGDDFGSLSTNPHALEQILLEFQAFGMKISEDDTYISKRYVFFTEELIEIPRSGHDTIDRIKKSRRWGRSIYVDCVKGRLLIDVRKNRDDYSYTPTGRISQLGRDISYLREGADATALFHLGSLLQDVYLHTQDYEGFTYFPELLFGEGKPLLFNNKRNFLRFILGRKECRSYARIMTEAGYAAYDRDGRNRSELLRFSRAMFRHSQDEPWRIKVKEIDGDEWKSIEMGAVPKYERHSRAIYTRLSRFVISESEVTGKLAKANFIESLIDPDKEYGFTGLTRVIDFDDGGIAIDKEELDRFLRIWAKDPNGFRTVRTERYFDRDKAEALIGYTYPLRVRISINPIYEEFTAREAMDRMEDHDAVVLWNWLKDSLEAGMALGTIPRRNLSDDEIILDGVEGELDLDLLFVVTNDKKLAIKVAELRGTKPTYRIPVMLWLESRCDYKLFGPPMTWNNVWVDMGSYEAVMSQLNVHGVSALTTFDTMKDIIVEDVLPGQIKCAPKAAPTRTDGPTAVHFPVQGFPERYRITIGDSFVSNYNWRRTSRR